ncbi:MAG: hypothetical protein HKN25_04480 [Pyrinomonadaceae bacterium]|nr:hypothetical protein [Pyrinomonadaceae bacterium]
MEMKVLNIAKVPEQEFIKLEKEFADLNTLAEVLTWAGMNSEGEFTSQIVSDVIAQDEYTHDVIVPFRDLFLVFDTT